MALALGLFFYAMSWLAYLNDRTEVVYYGFSILGNIWFAASYIARARS